MEEKNKKKLEKYVRNLTKKGRNILQKPSMYDVVLKDSSKESRDISYYILASIFRKSDENAAKSIEKLQESGSITCGQYTKDVAETKILSANECAIENGVSIKLSIQKGKSNVIEKS